MRIILEYEENISFIIKPIANSIVLNGCATIRIGREILCLLYAGFLLIYPMNTFACINISFSTRSVVMPTKCLNHKQLTNSCAYRIN